MSSRMNKAMLKCGLYLALAFPACWSLARFVFCDPVPKEVRSSSTVSWTFDLNDDLDLLDQRATVILWREVTEDQANFPILIEQLKRLDPSNEVGLSLYCMLLDTRKNDVIAKAFSRLATGKGMRRLLENSKKNPSFPKFLRQIEQGLDHPDMSVRANAVIALWHTAPSDPRIQPTVVKLMLFSEASWLPQRQMLSHVLENLDPSGNAVTNQLLVFLASTSNVERLLAANSIGRLRCEGTVDPLIRGLGDENFYVREACAIALGRIGWPAAKAIPALLQLSKQSQDDFHSVKLSFSHFKSTGPWFTDELAKYPKLEALLE